MKANFDKDNFTPVNEIFARGKVLKIGRGEHGPYEMTLISKIRRKDPLTLTFTLDKDCGVRAQERDVITVKGYTRAFNRYNEILQKETETMFFVATGFEPDVPELAKRFGDGLGHFCGEGVFRAFLSGTVVKAEKMSEKYGRLTIATCGGGSDPRPSYPVLRYFLSPYLPAFDYRPGDIVAVRCSGSTPQGKPRRNNKEFFFQNLIVEDIDYLYKVPRGVQSVEVAPSVDLGIAPEVREQMEIDDMLSSFNRSLAEEAAKNAE